MATEYPNNDDAMPDLLPFFECPENYPRCYRYEITILTDGVDCQRLVYMIRARFAVDAVDHIAAAAAKHLFGLKDA